MKDSKGKTIKRETRGGKTLNVTITTYFPHFYFQVAFIEMPKCASL